MFVRCVSGMIFEVCERVRMCCMSSSSLVKQKKRRNFVLGRREKREDDTESHVRELNTSTLSPKM